MCPNLKFNVRKRRWRWVKSLLSHKKCIHFILHKIALTLCYQRVTQRSGVFSPVSGSRRFSNWIVCEMTSYDETWMTKQSFRSRWLLVLKICEVKGLTSLHVLKHEFYTNQTFFSKIKNLEKLIQNYFRFFFSKVNRILTDFFFQI